MLDVRGFYDRPRLPWYSTWCTRTGRPASRGRDRRWHRSSRSEWGATHRLDRVLDLPPWESRTQALGLAALGFRVMGSGHLPQRGCHRAGEDRPRVADLRIGARRAVGLRTRGPMRVRSATLGRRGLRHRDRRRAAHSCRSPTNQVVVPLQERSRCIRHPRQAAFDLRQRFVAQAFRHRTFFTRLHQFAIASDAFIVAPGGIGPGDGDDLAAPPGAAPAGDAADPRRANVAGPDRVGPAGDPRLRPAPGRCRGPGDPALRGERRRSPRDHPGPSRHVAPRSADRKPLTALIAHAGDTWSVEETAVANSIEVEPSSQGRLAGPRCGSAFPMAVPGRERRPLPCARRHPPCAVSIATVRDRTPQRAESPVASRLHP